jgi:hypothetical protein
VERGKAFDVAMVGDDQRNLAFELARAPAIEQVGDAVEILRAEERDPDAARSGGQLPAHVELVGERREGCVECVEIEALLFRA